ncbi:MAG: S-methyl-5-thioribose-1-phosphate isomerase [Ruminococcaceae bacterium]|nr:S-methyl-5-thioribose-1-phosphate isomerase [Oscillospiraceae bacterium]
MFVTKQKLPDTVALNEVKITLDIIDQNRLPGALEVVSLCDPEAMWAAIKSLQVRGAPAIGVAAAIGLYVTAHRIAAKEQITGAAFIVKIKKARDYLASSRPTAVNLFWALDRMCRTAVQFISAGGSVDGCVKRMCEECKAIRDEDIAASYAIGEHGLTLLTDGMGILTHCNAGQLAAVRYGTALAPIHVGRERDMNFKVYCDETRPLLQGARLSAYELMADGVDTTIICDNMASQVMRDGKVQAVIVGADRITANGDAANKIGTSGVAILAKYYGIPFYVAAPRSTVDLSLASGMEIPIEQRRNEEITEMWYKNRMAPEGVGIFNPAFDVTPHELITAIITERGIVKPDYRENLAKIMEM